jgi:hypothetical protein
MDTLAHLHRSPYRQYDSASNDARAHAQARDGHDESRYGKPTLSAGEYMSELNERLRRHPKYLAGMHFPKPQPGSTPMLAAALAWEGPWECMDVFMSVLGDVQRDYDVID